MEYGALDAAPDLHFFERSLWDLGLDPIAGVDEVGRGCLAGPVVAAAVVFPRDMHVAGVRDSKALTPERRQFLDGLIRASALAVSVAQVSPRDIDRINILRASLKAMAQAVDELGVRPKALLVDGNQPIPHVLPQKTVVGGDRRSLSIAAASIVAKVFRDALMSDFHREYPRYNFAQNKGYPTPEHRRALQLYGACPLHRRSFKGVREVQGICLQGSRCG
jgi:ribonuclease HII